MICYKKTQKEVDNIKGGVEMEKRKSKIQCAKNGQGYNTYRITLPNTWVHAMSINADDRNVIITYDNEKITIEVC